MTLLALAGLIAALRWLTRYQPPEWDIGTYLVVGHELNCGGRLYLDVWDSKPPAIFATFALAERFTGYGGMQVYALSVAAAVATLAGVYAAAAAQSRAAGLWAAAFWAGICLDAPTGADLPNTEVFINCAMSWAVAILLRGSVRWRGAAAIGILFSLATLYKQIAVAPIAALLLVDLICLSHHRFARVLTVVLVMCATWACVFAYFAATGRAWIFWQTMFVYPRFYAGNLATNLLEALRPPNLLPRAMLQLAPLAAASPLVLLPRPLALPPRAGKLMLAWLIGTFLAVAWPGQFWTHYYQLYFPILAIAGGWGIDRLTRHASMKPTLSRVLGAMLALALIAPQIGWGMLPADAFVQRKYPASLFPRAQADAREIAGLLQPEESFYTWSDEAWMYARTGRRPPAAGLWKHHTLEGPLADWLSQRTVQQLEQSPPKLFIDWQDLPSPPEHPITRFRDTHYRLLDDGRTRWPFSVYVRED